MDYKVVHLEIPANNVDRVREFYGRLFGWEMSLVPGFDDYWIFGMEGGENPTMGGAVMKREAPGQVPITYFGVESIDRMAAQVESLGGRIVVPKSPVPGMGWMLHFQDPDGNLFALWQNDSSAS